MSHKPSFLFVIHARDWSDAGRRVADVLKIDEKKCVRFFSWAPLRFIIGTIALLIPFIYPRAAFTVCTPHGFDAQGKARGYIIALFLSGWQMKMMMRWNWTRRIAYGRLARAVIYAQKHYNITRVGLGAITAPLAGGGTWLAEDERIIADVTHGDTLTGAFVIDIVRDAMEMFGVDSLENKTVAVVGASGLVGSVATRLVAMKHKPQKMIITAHRRYDRLLQIATAMKTDGYIGEIVTTLETVDITNADIIILTTTATGDIVQPSMLRDGAIVIDMAQPINMSDAVIRACADEGKTVHRVDGGFIIIPNVSLYFSIGPPRGETFACLVETMTETLEGMSGHYVGSIDDMDFALQLRETAKKYGFHVAPLTNFSREIRYKNDRKAW